LIRKLIYEKADLQKSVGTVIIKKLITYLPTIIMKLNPLFYFIQDEIATHAQSNFEIIKKNGYILLKLGGRISILTKAFDEQHIRFDEKFNHENTFTPYHYTAYSQSHDEVLHVYFTSCDEVGTCLLNSELIDLNPDETCIHDTFRKISELRTLQANKVSELKKRYHSLEQEITEIENTSCGYWEKVEEIIRVLGKLKKYSEPVSCSGVPTFEGILKWYRRVLVLKPNSFSHQKIKKQKSLDYPEGLERHGDDESSEQKNFSIKPSRELDIRKYILNLNGLQKNLIRQDQFISDNLKQMNGKEYSIASDDVQLVKDFIEFHNAVYELVTNIEQRPTNEITSEELHEITKLQRYVMSMGGKLFKRYLYINAFFLARKLIGYLDSDRDFLFELAIKKANAPMLDFLLTFSKKTFPINTFVINDKRKHINPAAFCASRFRKDVKHRRCLSVLVKHGASLLMPDHITGYPVAYHVINHLISYALDALEDSSDKKLLCKVYLSYLAHNKTSLAQFIIKKPKAFHNELNKKLKEFPISENEKDIYKNLVGMTEENLGNFDKKSHKRSPEQSPIKRILHGVQQEKPKNGLIDHVSKDFNDLLNGLNACGRIDDQGWYRLFLRLGKLSDLLTNQSKVKNFYELDVNELKNINFFQELLRIRKEIAMFDSQQADEIVEAFDSSDSEAQSDKIVTVFDSPPSDQIKLFKVSSLSQCLGIISTQNQRSIKLPS
jgi:hypothetical protein